ncbi:gamma-aminobutyric acid type B receptor subunit 2-like [Amphiura filiformis]|uniref:gamma-aminobutyric acid type B receptor subunit 2-like n=1 Tax=Amphiura filiformis TaxID=82378 RepID=UPI003B22431F
MTHSGYVWLIYGFLADNWWTAKNDEIECSVKEMEEAILSSQILYVDYLPLSAKEEEPTVSGKTPLELMTELRDRLEWPENKGYTWTDYSFYGYDATWVAALTLNKSDEILKTKIFENGEKRRLDDFTYDDQEMAQIFFDTMAETDFDGFSGHITFTDGDRPGDCELGYYKGFEKRRAGRYFILQNTIEWMEDIVWGDDQVPLDHTAIIREYVGISLVAYVFMSILAGLGVMLAAFFFAFNIKNRDKWNVKMSSPNLNNIIIAGSILVYLSVIVAGLDRNTVSRNVIDDVCQLRVWLLSTGFVLAYGSMFSKTWRVYRVAPLKVQQRRVITDYNLFAMVLVFFCIDVLILILWQAIDPLLAEEIELGERKGLVGNANQRIISYTEQCSSDYLAYWLGVLFVFKGLLLLFGTFLAWEIRKVTVEALNDSKQIGICVYNTIVLCIVGVTVSFLIRDDTEEQFIFTSCIIIFCVTFTLLVLFVPKIKSVYRQPEGTQNQAQNTYMTSMKADPIKGTGSSDTRNGSGATPDANIAT